MGAMREILFRGKKIINGEWIYGYYFQRQNVHSEDGQPIKHCISDLPPFGAEVLPKTVGQYIGLTDKNGKKIFEGDVIKTQPFRNKPYSLNAKRKCHIGVVENRIGWNGYHWEAKIEDYGPYQYGNPFENCEIIGNIHDNPELLKGGAEQ